MSEKKRKKKDGQDKGKQNQARRRANKGSQSGRDLPPDRAKEHADAIRIGAAPGRRRARTTAPRPSPSTSSPPAARLKAAREGKGK
jgi:hypothetical protein